MSDMDIAATAVHCTRALEAAGIECAIGGAIALGVWCPPRATLDVDLTIFVDMARTHDVLRVLERAGAHADMVLMARRLQNGEAAMLRMDGVRLDVFLPSIPFYAEAQTRVVPMAGATVPVLSAEAIAVFKLLFFRKKDLVDLERLLSFRRDRLDHKWVRSQIADMLGDEDPRIVAWDGIVASVTPPI
jgi:hypothetical protein